MTNRNIDAILKGTLAIDIDWALSCFKQYDAELRLVENGVPYSELGFSEKRKQSFTTVLKKLGDDEFEDVTVKEFESNPSVGSIAHLKLNGVMRTGDGISSRGVESLADDIKRIDENTNIKAAILEVNSGGGEIIASQILQNAIRDFTKPMYVLSHFTASAALRAVLPATKHYASSTTSEIGSIGVLVQIDKNVIAYIKENIDTIYSERSPNKNQELREYLKGNSQPIIDSLNKTADLFINEVKTYRNLVYDSEDTVKGGMFLADDARERGLIDGIATFAEIVKEINSLNIENVKVMTNFSETSLGKVLAAINKFFGWTFSEESDVAQIVANFNDLGSFDQMKVGLIEPLQQQVDQLQALVAGLQKSVEDFSIERTTFIEERSALNAKIAELDAQNMVLTKSIADLHGKAGVMNNNDSPLQGVVGIVSEMLESIQPSGDTKY